MVFLAEILPTATNQNYTTSYGRHFSKLGVRDIDFNNGLKLDDFPNLGSENTLNLDVFELNVNVKDFSSVTY